MIRLSVRSTYGYGAIALLGAAVLPWAAADPAYWPLMVASCMVVSASLVLLWRADAVSMPLVLGGALVLRLFYLPLEPVLSDDVYRYLWDARLLVEGGINPYTHPPEADVLRSWRDEWLYPALNSQAYHSVYPPFSQAIFAASYLVGGEGWASYYMMKVMFVAAELSGVWALGRYVEARDLMLYAWHPLALLEIAGQGHTEALAVGGVGIALWAVWSQRKYLAAVAIALAGLAKLYPWVAFAWLFRRYGFRPVFAGGAVIAILFVPFWYRALFVDLGQSLRLYVQLFEFNAGPYYVVKGVLGGLTGQDWSKVIGPVFGGLTLLGLAVWILRDWLKPVSLATFIVGALGIYLALATTVHPWYWLVVGLVAVLHPVTRWAWMWIATLSIGTYLFYIDGPYLVWVVLGWGGAALLLVVGWIQQGGLAGPRARQKIRAFSNDLTTLNSTENESPTLLDIGCGEGAVGAYIHEHYSMDVTLTDLHNDIQADLPFVQCTADRLPFSDHRFDAALLSFVLHHAENPEQVMQEALRVSRHVLVLESVAYHPLQRCLLGWTDAAINAIRSGGTMAPPHPETYRSLDNWTRWMEKQGGQVVRKELIPGRLHPWAVLVVRPTQRASASSDTSLG